MSLFRETVGFIRDQEKKLGVVLLTPGTENQCKLKGVEQKQFLFKDIESGIYVRCIRFSSDVNKWAKTPACDPLLHGLTATSFAPVLHHLSCQHARDRPALGIQGPSQWMLVLETSCS